MRVKELAAALQLAAEGDGEREITGAASLEAAASTDVSFAGAPKFYDPARNSQAGCIIAPADYVQAVGQTVLRAPVPRAAFAAALQVLFPPRAVCPGIHPTAVIDATARVDESCEIGSHVSIGPDTVIEPECVVSAGCTIAGRVRIGRGSLLHPRVSIYSHVEIGQGAVLHSGCVIGADGFGFVLTGDRYQKFPQVGGVRIGRNVEMGANTCIDRAALGMTEIGDGVKLDNMVHIAHNCRIGNHVIIAAQTGLSGGVVVEDYAIIGGQVGIGDKARIESRAVLGSGSGVLTSKIVRRGSVLWGTPARPLREHLEELAHLRRLPALREELKELRKRLAKVEEQM